MFILKLFKKPPLTTKFRSGEFVGLLPIVFFDNAKYGLTVTYKAYVA
jgi:hypothetical protein